MPAVYNWNNGMVTWRRKAEDDPGSTSDAIRRADQNESRLNDPSGRTGFNYLGSRRNGTVKAASFVNPIQDDGENNLAEKIKAIEEDIRNDSDEISRPTLEPSENLPPNVEHAATEQHANFANRNIVSDPNSALLPHDAFYNDPFLLTLINDTLQGNQELKILAEEIQIACNEAYARSGEYRPFVSLGAGAGLDKSGRHTRNGAVEEQLDVSPGREFPDPLGDFLVAANLSWEIDIWNRLRNSHRSAAMQYLGTKEGQNYIVTRVVAEVAENYYELLALDSRLQILTKTIEIQQASLKVAEGKKDAGRGTELAVQRFRAEVEKNRSERALLLQKIVETENRINLLAGRYPQPIKRISTDFVELNLGVLSVGVPSELLLNRADIRQAEYEVSAAGLNVQVARARFYPNLSLNAGLGWNAFSTGYLFRTPESLIYGLAGELVGPLINKRAIKADYRTANAEQLQAIYNYHQTVLKAHIEVVNHISKVENFRNSIELKRKQLTALEASVEAASKLFQNARAEYVEVLLAQREMMEAKIILIETKQEQLNAVVNAYQAIGGGLFVPSASP